MRRASIPWWVRSLVSLSDRCEAVARAVAVARSEILFAYLSPERRERVTAALYGAQRTYAPGGRRFEAGLFDWERELYASPEFPRPPARVLIGGAGGGREVVALRALGYGVHAFEPSSALSSAGSVATGGAIIPAGYDDFVSAANGESNALSETLRAGFDAIILGWGSYVHVLDDASKVAVLAAARRVAPTAPVAFSFASSEAYVEGERVARLRHMLRAALPKLGGRHTVHPRDSFDPWAGFSREPTAAEVPELAKRAGYRVALLKTESDMLRALLVPAQDLDA